MRKLEFLVVDVQENGVDMLIIVGGIQLNYCCLIFVVVVKEKMKCIFVLEEGFEIEEKRDFNGNYFLYYLLGVENVIVVLNGVDLMEEMYKVVKEVSEKGNILYVILVGGLNFIGVMGYVVCV